jgi:hypothetical protein
VVGSCSHFDLSIRFPFLPVYVISYRRSRLEYRSVFWNFITTTNSDKPVHIQHSVAVPSYNSFLPHVSYSYTKDLGYLKFHDVHKKSNYLDIPFLFQIDDSFKNFPSLLEADGLQVLTWFLRDSSTFNFSPSIKTCPAARGASAVDAVCRDS